MPADVPDFMKKMIGETVDVVQTEDWGAPDADGQRTADVVVQIKGQPAVMNGTAAIVASGGEVVMQIEGDLKVSIPFFGKKVEPEIAKGIYAAVRQGAEDRRDPPPLTWCLPRYRSRWLGTEANPPRDR